VPTTASDDSGELGETAMADATERSPFSKFLAPCIRKTYLSTTTSTLGCMNPCTTTPITPSTATTRLAVTLALLQQRRAPRLLISLSHRLYITFVVYRDYSWPGRTGSTSTLPRVATTRLTAALTLHRLHRAP
jgi:hypothetical protein